MWSFVFTFIRVVIQIGGYNDFSLEMRSLQDKVSKSDECNDSESATFNGLTKRFQPEFDVDWCSYKLVSKIHCEFLSGYG